MGMTGRKVILNRIAPKTSGIMAGVRMITVMSIGIATIASYIGAGGLGDWIFLGMFTVDTDKIIAGALPLCILAILADFLLVKLQHKLEVWRDDTQEKNKNLVKEG